MLNRIIWFVCIVGFVGIVVLAGLIHHDLANQKQLTTPYAQESFTVPVYDKSYPETVVYGPDTVIEEA